jgi:hypothetical protein
VHALHADWAWIAVLGSGGVGLSGLWLAITRRRPGRWFTWAVGACGERCWCKWGSV